jgi:hypothetical protein
MGIGTVMDELFGITERRTFDYRPRVASILERAGDETLALFVRRLTTPPWLDLPRTPPVPWPQPIEAPRVVPANVRV